MTDQKNIEVTVRAVEATDFEALADLMTQLGYQTRASEMQMRMEPILANKNYATFVGISDGKVCGMIGTFTCYTYEQKFFGEDPGAGRVGKNARPRCR